MKMKLQLCVVILLCISNFAKAQLSNARSSALSSADLLLIDEWSIITNSASTAYLEKPAIGIGFNRNYLISELDEKSVTFGLPFLNNNCFSIAYSVFGYELYKDQNLYFSYARKFSESFSVGLQFNNHQQIPGEEYQHIIENHLSFGINAKLTSKISIAGNYKFNFKGSSNSEVPLNNGNTLALGFKYVLSEKFAVYFQGRQFVNERFVASAAMEYEYLENFFLRAGISSNPLKGSFGFGFKYKSIKFSASCSRHEILGYSPSISIGLSK